jgi:hypothetical protein
MFRRFLKFNLVLILRDHEDFSWFGIEARERRGQEIVRENGSQEWNKGCFQAGIE